MSAWSLLYDNFDPSRERLREALCTLGNGLFATRGAAPESDADSVHYPGTYVHGCYDRATSEVSGRTVENEDLVNAPNWLCFTFRIGGAEWFDLKRATILGYRQELDMRKGTLTRLVRFRDPEGHETRLVQRRFVDMADPHLAGLETTIVPENWEGQIDIRSGLDGRVVNSGVDRYKSLNGSHLTAESTDSSEEETFVQVATSQSRIRIAEAARTRVVGQRRPVPPGITAVKTEGYAGQQFSVELSKGEEFTVEKIVTLFTSKDRAVSECGQEARERLRRVSDFNSLLESHTKAWGHLWNRFEIKLHHEERISRILNFHIFHLLQTVSPNTIDLDAGVPARGLHGEAYRGHIFWDELFVFPLLNLRIPDLTRSLLLYRYRRLPEARWSAKESGFRGAMYPWQSGSDGREESQRFHLNPLSGRWVPDNTSLQRHVGIAIAYNVWNYYQVTGDLDFLWFYGAEMLLEISRFWAAAARYNRSRDRYDIRGVIGPDEYHDRYPDQSRPGIDNNAYTNIMASWVLSKSLEVLEQMPQNRRESLEEKLSLRREEVQRWEDIARRMYVPFDGEIICQFEGYEKLEEFEWESYRRKYGDIQRLDRILESEGDTPNRYKLSKQADVLMLFYLLSPDELGQLVQRLGYQLKPEAITKNIEYYLHRTSHGSTLSRVVHSWVMARSLRETSWKLFQDALESDISDIQGGTTAEGIHLGAMAGVVDIVQRCYTGLELREDALWLNPALPQEVKQLSLNMLYRGHEIDLDFTADSIGIRSRAGQAPPVLVRVGEKTVEVSPGASVELKPL